MEDDSLPGACALDVLEEIDAGVIGTADGAMPDSHDDFLELLFLPGTISRVRHGQDFPNEVLERVDLEGNPFDDGLKHGNDPADRNLIEPVLFIGFAVGFAPPVSSKLLVGGSNPAEPLPAKAGRFLFRLKVGLRLKPPEESPAHSRLKARWAR